MIGFFITLGLTLCFTLLILWRCWIKEMIEDYIDDLLCCGYGEEIKKACSFFGICCECCEPTDKVEKQELELATIPKNNPPRIPENIIISRDPNTYDYRKRISI